MKKERKGLQVDIYGVCKANWNQIINDLNYNRQHNPELLNIN